MSGQSASGSGGAANGASANSQGGIPGAGFGNGTAAVGGAGAANTAGHTANGGVSNGGVPNGAAGHGESTAGGAGAPLGGAGGQATAASGGGGSAGQISAVAVVGFSEIELDLENKDSSRGTEPSCTDGSMCHSNPARHVVIVPNPTPDQLRENWQHIVNVPTGDPPWVTPPDETAQMLNEVPIPDDMRARWLAWIEAGAPFDAP
jgi:hypothetical protein